MVRQGRIVRTIRIHHPYVPVPVVMLVRDLRSVRGKILLKPCDIEQFMKRPKEGLDQMVEEVMGKLAGKAHLEQRILRINQESGGL